MGLFLKSGIGEIVHAPLLFYILKFSSNYCFRFSHIGVKTVSSLSSKSSPVRVGYRKTPLVHHKSSNKRSRTLVKIAKLLAKRNSSSNDVDDDDNDRGTCLSNVCVCEFLLNFQTSSSSRSDHRVKRVYSNVTG